MHRRVEKVLAVNSGRKLKDFESFLSKDIDKSITQQLLHTDNTIKDQPMSMAHLKALLHRRNPDSSIGFMYTVSTHGTLLYKDTLLTIAGVITDIKV